MKQSICIRCGGMDFELRASDLKLSGTRLAFVQCASCGGVIGVVEVARNDQIPQPPEEEKRPANDAYQVEL